jgi:hypothetical protein
MSKIDYGVMSDAELLSAYRKQKGIADRNNVTQLAVKT